MQTEANFTLPEIQREIPFAIIVDRDGAYVLYSIFNGVEYKFSMTKRDGIFMLSNGNPFTESDEIVNEKLIELSSDFLEKQSQGFDPTSEIYQGKNKPGYGPDDIFVENKPFSLKQIIDLIEDGDIELSPDFQRNFVWDKTRQSRLIESILLGLPLPSIYLSQYEDGRLTVVDGLQRLSTIKLFMDDQLKLTNLEYLENCNDKRFSQLDSVLSPLRLRRFGQTQVMCYVIDYRSPSQLKFDLFRRLNTGGKPLNNQEIRNCLSRPTIQQLLKEMIAQPSFSEATDNSVKDTRMDAREAALRFIYFYEQYTDENPVGQYNGDMETTLDNFVDVLNKRPDQEVIKYVSIYDNAMRNAYHLFGKQCFRKVTSESLEGRRSQVNKLMMLTLSILLSKYQNSKIVEHGVESLTGKIADLISSQDGLFETLTYSTNSKANIETSFRSFRGFLVDNLGAL